MGSLKSSLVVFGAIAVTLLLAGCSSQPGEADGRRAFQASMASRVGDEPFEVQSFAKSDGQSQEAGGVKLYQMQYEATVLFPNGIRPECLKDHSHFTGFNNYFQGLNCMMDSESGALRPQPPGARVKYEGTVGFEKTERYWKPSVQISTTTGLSRNSIGASGATPEMASFAAAKPKVIWDWAIGVPEKAFPLSSENTKNIWSTSVYSYTGTGGGPGGGAEDDKLRVGGYGDVYVSLLQPPLIRRPLSTPTNVSLALWVKDDDGTPTGFAVEEIRKAWDWKRGDRLWWRDLPTSERVSEQPAPARNQWVQIDITNIYLRWLKDPSQAYGILLRPLATNNNFDSFVSTRSADASRRPRLLVVY